MLVSYEYLTRLLYTVGRDPISLLWGNVPSRSSRPKEALSRCVATHTHAYRCCLHPIHILWAIPLKKEAVSCRNIWCNKNSWLVNTVNYISPTYIQCIMIPSWASFFDIQVIHKLCKLNWLHSAKIELRTNPPCFLGVPHGHTLPLLHTWNYISWLSVDTCLYLLLAHRIRAVPYCCTMLTVVADVHLLFASLVSSLAHYYVCVALYKQGAVCVMFILHFTFS